MNIKSIIVVLAIMFGIFGCLNLQNPTLYNYCISHADAIRSAQLTAIYDSNYTQNILKNVSINISNVTMSGMCRTTVIGRNDIHSDDVIVCNSLNQCDVATRYACWENLCNWINITR